MKECNCLSAPKYHRSDCPVFDEWGKPRDNFKRHEYILQLYSKRQKKVEHLVILEEDNIFYFFQITPDPHRLFERASATLTQCKKYSNRFDTHCCTLVPAEIDDMNLRLKKSRLSYKIYKYDEDCRRLIEK